MIAFHQGSAHAWKTIPSGPSGFEAQSLAHFTDGDRIRIGRTAFSLAVVRRPRPDRRVARRARSTRARKRVRQRDARSPRGRHRSGALSASEARQIELKFAEFRVSRSASTRSTRSYRAAATIWVLAESSKSLPLPRNNCSHGNVQVALARVADGRGAPRALGPPPVPAAAQVFAATSNASRPRPAWMFRELP